MASSLRRLCALRTTALPTASAFAAPSSLRPQAARCVSSSMTAARNARTVPPCVLSSAPCSSSRSSGSSSSVPVRSFSTRQSVDDFVEVRRRSKPEMRQHAVSILDGDYGDHEDEDGDGEERPFASGPEYDDMDDDGWSLTPADALDAAKARGAQYKDPTDELYAEDDEAEAEEARYGLGIPAGSGTSEEDLKIQAEALKQQREFDEQRQRWAENARPKVRVREIDDRGRAYGRGGRKTASARVWIYPGEGTISVNRRSFVDFFPRESDREAILSPFVATRTAGYFDARVQVEGGGVSGKAGAVRHGLARALEKYNPEYRPAMKKLGFLTRDSRMVERKKVGKKKARKSPQWVRR